LSYCGYDIHDLAQHSTFEEVVYLLHHQRLPTQSELEDLHGQMIEERDISGFLRDLMGTLAQQTSPMSMLRTSISAASAYDPDGWDQSADANYRKAIRLVARTPTLIASYHRLRSGQEPIPPNEKLPHAANFLAMLLGGKQKIMGFGHRVYKTEDPRATHLRRLSQELGQRAGEPKWHEIAARVEKVVMDEKGLYPNVDFYAATVYHSLGIPTDLMTPI